MTEHFLFPFFQLGEAILVTVPPARYDPNDDAPIPLADHRSHRPRASRTSSIRSNGSAHLADGSAAERQTLMFNADDEDDFSAPPRLPSQQQQSSKAIATGATKTPPLNGEGNTRVRSPFGIRETGSETDVDQMRLPVVSRTTSADGALSVSALERGKKADALSILSAESDEPEDGLDGDEGGDAGGGISEKAGIILVRSRTLLPFAIETEYSTCRLIGHSQHLRRRPSIPSHRPLVHPLRASGFPNVRLGSRTRWASCRRDCTLEKRDRRHLCRRSSSAGPRAVAAR